MVLHNFKSMVLQNCTFSNTFLSYCASATVFRSAADNNSDASPAGHSDTLLSGRPGSRGSQLKNPPPASLDACMRPRPSKHLRKPCLQKASCRESHKGRRVYLRLCLHHHLHGAAGLLSYVLDMLLQILAWAMFKHASCLASCR